LPPSPNVKTSDAKAGKHSYKSVGHFIDLVEE
jgi:hypothetical protein